MQTILITGMNGQLGNELRVLAPSFPEFNFIYTDIAELDITNNDAVTEFFTEYKPDICINAAAYTAVDKAETEKDITLLVNAGAVKNLATACRLFKAKFIHVSTDYVFDGLATEPYKEDDTTDPVNYYGYTKLKGEEFALGECPSTIVIRTSWVYSSFGNNFVKTMLRLMKDRESISVVADQYGSPTYAADLAEAILKIAQTFKNDDESKYGIYHYSNEGDINWFNFASAIKNVAGYTCRVNPISTADYPTPAKRPAYSVFNKEKIKTTFGIQLKDWKSSLEKCYDLLSNA